MAPLVRPRRGEDGGGVLEQVPAFWAREQGGGNRRQKEGTF